MTERDFAIEVVSKLQKAGFQALWAGGCVRDLSLGVAPADYDVATDARPEAVQKLFRRTIAVGASFGVIEVIGPRDADGEWLKVQVATFRNDGVYSDGRRPDSVTFSSAEEDALRRDFTINGMFYDPIANQFHDFVGGLADLKARILRAIGDPVARFQEDKLRVLRAVRMAARFQLEIDPETFHAARRMASLITQVSAERIAEELRKIFVHPERTRGIALLHDFDLLGPIFPEFPQLDLPEPTWTARLESLQRLSAPRDRQSPVTFPLVFSLFLHDREAKRIEQACKRLRFSTDENHRINWLIQHQNALRNAQTLKNSQLYPLLIHPGVGELLALHHALDRDSSNSDSLAFCENLLRNTRPEDLDPAPLLTGDHLISAGWKPGREFKTVLQTVRDAQLDRLIHSHDEALALAAQIRDAAGR